MLTYLVIQYTVSKSRLTSDSFSFFFLFKRNKSSCLIETLKVLLRQYCHCEVCYRLLKLQLKCLTMLQATAPDYFIHLHLAKSKEPEIQVACSAFFEWVTLQYNAKGSLFRTIGFDIFHPLYLVVQHKTVL